jgi:hypothetical protein
VIEVPDRAEDLEGQALDPGAVAELPVLVDLGVADGLVEAAQAPPGVGGEQQEVPGGVRELRRRQLIDAQVMARIGEYRFPRRVARLPPVTVPIHVVAHRAINVLVLERRRCQPRHQGLG